MELFTKVEISDYPNKISRSSRLMTAGSCFADTVGGRLLFHKFQTLNNPFGTVFNPVLLFELLSAGLREDFLIDESLFVQNGDVWYHHLFHGSFSALRKDELKRRIRETVSEAGEFLRNADFLIITFGTAFIYTLRSSGKAVSNCHKLPAALFEKTLSTPEDLVNGFQTFRAMADTINPRLRYIFTVSPVRHTRDTLPLNSVSKAVLLLACRRITEQFDRTVYFPAYEIMTDELRDYRFYNEDMVHPSLQAQDYIFDRFREVFWDMESRAVAEEWESVARALAHRPFHPDSEAHKRFLIEISRRLEDLQPRLNVSEEISVLTKKLAELPHP